MTRNLVFVCSIVLCQKFSFLHLSCLNKLIIINVSDVRARHAVRGRTNAGAAASARGRALLRVWRLHHGGVRFPDLEEHHPKEHALP